MSGVRNAAEALALAKSHLEASGYEVQTTRVCTNSFEEYLPPECSVDEAVGYLQELEDAMGGVDYLSVGTAQARLDVMEAALSGQTQKVFFVMPLGLTGAGVPDHRVALNLAEIVCRLGASAPPKTSAVPDLFRTTVAANLGPGTPYFPGAYWEGGAAPALALALEDTGLLVKAFAGASSLDAAQAALWTLMCESVIPLEEAAKAFTESLGVDYAGIDCSIASASAPEESMVVAYESLGFGPVGGAGTLSISAMITAALKRLPVKRCGYSGLMLPLTEDAGLAQRGSDGCLSVQQLLFYSAVCGTGVDTVPIEGSTAPDRLAMVYMDMASLAFRLNKPLSARLWPVAGKRVGEMTEVDNPVFVNTRVLTVDPVAFTALPPPAAKAESCAGVGGEVTVLSNSPEALVVRLGDGCQGLALVLQNDGTRPWPRDTSLRLLGNPDEHLAAEVVSVPSAVAGEKVTLCVVIGADTLSSSRYRLFGGGSEFGPALILVP